MPKHAGLPARRRSQGQEIIGLFVGFMAAYLAAEGMLRQFLHPVHWIVAGLGALGGYWLCLIWFRWGPPGRRP